MTNQEAETVVQIMLTADSYCAHCARRLLTQFIQKFNSKKVVVQKMWRAQYDEEWEAGIDDIRELLKEANQ